MPATPHIVNHLRDEEARLAEAAVRAIDKLIADATAKRAQVVEHGYPTTTIGGSCLNGQNITDAERALTTLHAIADARVIAERGYGLAPRSESGVGS